MIKIKLIHNMVSGSTSRSILIAIVCLNVFVLSEVDAKSSNETINSDNLASNVTKTATFSTGNRLWDNLIQDCLQRPSFSCIQKNVYHYLDDTLEVGDFNMSNRILFTKNTLDYTKYTKKVNEEYYDEHNNEIPDAGRAAEFEPVSPIEEVTTALKGKSLKFMLTHDMNVKLPEVMFDGATFRIEPRSFEGNGMIAKLEFIPKSEIEARGNGSPRIFFKAIKKFFKNKLLLAFLAIILVIKIIKIKVMWLLPLLVGVGTAKKLILKFLLFLFPALAHIFKLCSYYHSSFHKPNFHHHQHHISHLHSFIPDDHGHGHGHGNGHGHPPHTHLPELIYTKPPRGHPSEYLHGAPVPPHQHYQPDWELSGPGLGSEYISDINRNSHVDTSFKPKYDDLNDINSWGLGVSTSAPASSPSHSYNVNPFIQDNNSRIGNKPHPGYPSGPVYTQPKRVPTAAASQIASQYATAPSGSTAPEDLIIREAQRQEALRIQAEQRLIAKQQQIINNQAFVNEGQTPRPIDSFYSPILQRLDKTFLQLGVQDESCRERIVCSMYKNPAKYSPHSNYVSAELSRDASELQKPSSTNSAVLRFYRYVQAARDGQDQRDCLRLYPQCAINTEKKKK